jgi:hypothetical protein
MNIILRRDVLTPEFTLGRMALDNGWQCYTVEDAVRDAKIPGKTAIPYGRYKVIITLSQRFKRMLPLLVDVPNYEGVRIHPGNTAEDTEGCILPGRVRTPDGVGDSRIAFNELHKQIEQALLDGEQCWIDIVA